MKFAIVESVVTEGGHEIDYDRILVEELTSQGHIVEFYVPEGHIFKCNYGVPVHHLKGSGISYKGTRGIKKIWLSIKREFNRQMWYKQVYRYACDKCFDAIIFPSATYRYLRALGKNDLIKSPIPVIFIMHGLTPKEVLKVFKQATSLKKVSNIKIAIQTFAKEKLQMLDLPNIYYFDPPAYIPRDIETSGVRLKPDILKLGFFGQYRKEKNLDGFLDIFTSCKFSRPVKLIIQGATQSQTDADDFERLIAKYANMKDIIEFINRPLIGRDWQSGIASIDALIMPYGNERYRYHTSAMLSTAIGFNKAVVIADNVNPEVIHKYRIGESFPNGDMTKFKQILEEFVNNFDSKSVFYSEQLFKANAAFAPSKLAEKLIYMATSP